MISKINNLFNEKALFIIPHFVQNGNDNKLFIKDTIQSIFNQTDKNWKIIIIDDNSSSKKAVNYLKLLANRYQEKIKIIFKNINHGPGKCRNIGIEYAYNNNFPFILFNDSDDISNNKRLEVTRNIFKSDPDADVVYSTFNIIDENNNLVLKNKLTPSILEILEAHENNPPQGKNVWIDIAVKTGYINLTTATAVKTYLAYENPFPEERISEDAHTWMRYSAAGGKFVYTPLIPGSYRIPQNSAGSSSRSREGTKEEFYSCMMNNNTDGFMKSLDLALKNNSIDISIVNDLIIRFNLRSAETLIREGLIDLAYKHINKAKKISLKKTKEYILNNSNIINILK